MFISFNPQNLYVAINDDGKRVHKDNRSLICNTCSKNHYSYEHNTLNSLGWGPNFNLAAIAHKNLIAARKTNKNFYYNRAHNTEPSLN